ncbi:inner membrane-spanning protein YciB [Phaeovulum vinaykumarii]|uniref:Inner membrane-spanning protein YciB n=1 Tax=Phaeovulum vinaykumarii TaxID=407234 RepID=A0A1N7L6H8_9RHOB|nr:inner membrane-spanning protein YciB [Phaeovulum vinaykumarii]SIS69401.1 intracellular septation protein [Phaeovulum vinaykumarii]SOB99508.1 intracellular septation protein A [Phaeovulum vinaykumarii]
MTDKTGRKINPWLKFGLEFGPLVVFFVVFARLKDQSVSLLGTEYSGFVVATAAFVPILVVSILALWRLTGRMAPMQAATLVLVLVFGGLSVWLNDPRFFKMKPTIIYLLFAGVLGLGALLGKSWLALVMDEVLPMQPEGWRILTRRIIGLFLALAVANEAVWRLFSDGTWVNFKVFGLPLIMFAFFMAQGGLFSRYALPQDDDAAPK